MQTKVVLRGFTNKSRVKVFSQIIGVYLCPGSLAEIAERQRGEKGKRKRKKTCQATPVPEALHLCYGNRVEAAHKTVKVKET
jgi:hypothetical protein